MKHFSKVTVVSSLMIVLLTYFHAISGGLITGLNIDGTKRYSNELLSAGGDDSRLIAIAFYTFIFSIVYYVFSSKQSALIYYLNLLVVYFILLLVNLDVSIFTSILSGDYLLAITLIVLHQPLVFHLLSLSKAAKNI